MANEKISQLPAGAPAQTTDEVPIARSGANFRLFISDIIALFANAIGFGQLTTGTNTQAAMTVGTGASLGRSGSGSIDASKIDGVTVTGTPSAGQVITATSSSTADWESPVGGIVGASTTQSTGDQAVAQNTNTTVLTKSVTMPSSGGPFRVFGSYGIFLSTGNSGVQVAWINDGSDANAFAAAQNSVTGSDSAFGINGSEFSHGTYANGANVTFNLRLEVSNSGGVTAVQHNNNNPTTAESTWLNIVIFPSA